jgi:anthranilate phosphoribosyltransferase
MRIQDRFVAILKQKGTGKTMSKHMDDADLDFVLTHMNHPDAVLETLATLLVAWQQLPATAAEAAAWQRVQSDYATLVPTALHALCQPGDTPVHRSMRGEALSASVIQATLDAFFEGRQPGYDVAALLESLRLREETLDENVAFYTYFRSKTARITVDCPLLIDMATPYDGFNRNYFLQPFVAALLGAIGLPCVLHGVKAVSPKRGLSTHNLLLQAGKNPFMALDRVAQSIMDPTIGWGYVDQSIFCPSLHALVPLRQAMVKRPVLATIEKWLCPLSAQQTLCVTGFTHPPYKQKTIDIIQRIGVFSRLLLVRGVEGSTLLPFDRRTPFIVADANESVRHDFMAPATVGVSAASIPEADPAHTREKGLQGLRGADAAITAYLGYQVVAITQALGMDRDAVWERVTQAVSSGRAVSHWERGARD